ncbi:MAG TPA: 4-hydroxythreonine-4-phosphate dehydrogenase PdxA [Elusimicrobiota bacterium]|nr:4-hydroxythreonine-4-phosphate dehydrogenase PdxA [Elusimicrobiota bacterium]
MKPRLAITLGDPAGVGPEIVSAALREGRVLRACEPVVVGDPFALALHRCQLPEVEMLSVPGLNRKLRLGRPSREAGRSAIESLERGLDLIRARQAHALVTAPVSKESFHLADLHHPGHTEWLAQQTQSGPVAMLMAAGPMRAILVTRHLALSAVSRHLSPEALESSIRLGWEFVRRVLRRSAPRLVACGLNPHAGDGGLLGEEESAVIAPVLRQFRRQRMRVAGPISADSAFRDLSLERYDLALAMYHDQGMIPLKVFDADRLVNITLGLPFVRTSPGHGTAYDIAGKNRANPKPMIEAILLAAAYCQSSPPVDWTPLR